MIDVPMDKTAAAHARCMELLDAGACIIPETDEDEMTAIIEDHLSCLLIVLLEGV